MVRKKSYNYNLLAVIPIVVMLGIVGYLSIGSTGPTTTTECGSACSTTTITETNCSSNTGLLAIVVVCSTVTTTSSTTTTTTSTTSTSTGPCSTCLTAPPGALTKLVNYFVNTYNPNVGLIAVGNSGNGGVNFCYPNNTVDCNNGGTYCGLVPFNEKYLPFESWKDAAGMDGLGVQSSVVNKIYSTIQGLHSSVNWIPPNNLESTLGYIISYKIQNTNICFTPNGGAPSLLTYNGAQAQIDQAAAWNYGTQSYLQPDRTISDGLRTGTSNINILAQALNFYLRNDLPDAKTDLQNVANTCTVSSDGSAIFDRPMTMGMFLEGVEVIGSPIMPPGCTIQNIVNTLWALQNNDGGIASSYSCAFSSNCSKGGSTDENSNAALDAFSPGLILHVQAVAASHAYNTNSIPSYSPTIGI